MTLGTINFAASNILQYQIDYRLWLQKGETLTSVSFVVDAGNATITKITYSPDQKEVLFFVNGATVVAGVDFNILATAITSFGQQRTDTIAVNVAAAGS